MFPTPLHQVKLQQIILLKLERLTHQVSKRLDRVTLLLIITILIVAGLREHVGETQDTQDTDKY